MGRDDQHRLGAAEQTQLSVDRRIELLARRQHGVVTHKQLFALGLGKGAIKWRRNHDRLFEIYKGVYSVGRRDLTPLGRLSAALLRCGKGARLNRWSAAQRLGWAPDYRGPIQISVPRTPPTVKGLDVVEAHLSDYDIRRKDNLAMTSDAMTLIDLAPELDDTSLAELFQKALRFGITTKQLERTLKRYKRRPGTPKLKRILEKYRDQQGRSRGDFEDACWVWLLDILPPGAERPERNALVEVAPGEFREGDAVFHNAKVWFEFDFHGHHGATAKTATNDHQRDRLIRAAGWDLVRFTDYEFDHDREAIEAEVRKRFG